MRYGELFTADNMIVAGATALVVLLAVLVMYEVLNLLSRRLLPAIGPSPRRRSFALVVTILAVHTIEIWLFGGALWLLTAHFELGSVSDQAPVDLFGVLYFSAAAYTTAGWGDVTVLGPVRLLAGTESLVGLVLITWSASFTYAELRRSWT